MRPEDADDRQRGFLYAFARVVGLIIFAGAVVLIALWVVPKFTGKNFHLSLPGSSEQGGGGSAKSPSQSPFNWADKVVKEL